MLKSGGRGIKDFVPNLHQFCTNHEKTYKYLGRETVLADNVEGLKYRDLWSGADFYKEIFLQFPQ